MEEDLTDKPNLHAWLSSFLSVQRRDYERQYTTLPETEEDARLFAALDELQKDAASVITTGVVKESLANALNDFRPGEPIEAKVKHLLSYTIVQHRLEFDVAEEVCERLHELDKRVQWSTLVQLIMLGYKPSETAVKYFTRATTLYLAGYGTEAVIMCGAVLEAALAVRFPNEMLKASNYKPVFQRTGEYSVGQRLKYEREHPVLTDEQRQAATQLVNWRNDAVHVQPDIGPDPDDALMNLATVLPVLLS